MAEKPAGLNAPSIVPSETREEKKFGLLVDRLGPDVPPHADRIENAAKTALVRAIEKSFNEGLLLDIQAFSARTTGAVNP
ncbi:hypothetical protein [Roseovarius sp.]|uniref:hypothetical protein n=1 Tax=Roseovarius sp. TaxID=1486281 RepID=UPI00260E8E4D|nr:hypothetical protein [Roseovarius sp.]